MDYGTWKHQNAIDNYSFDLFPSTFACYRTRLKKLGPFEVCEADFVRARNLSMTAQSENYTIFYINTPGRLRGRTYVNRYYFECMKLSIVHGRHGISIFWPLLYRQVAAINGS